MVVDELARGDPTFKSKFNGRLSETRMGDSRLALLEPETYMNESSRSISAAARYFKVASQDVLVVHDDVDLGRADCRRDWAVACRDTTACGRSLKRSERRSSFGCGSVWGDPCGATRVMSPTTC